MSNTLYGNVIVHKVLVILEMCKMNFIRTKTFFNKRQSMFNSIEYDNLFIDIIIFYGNVCNDLII